VGFVQNFAIVIEIAVIHTCLESEILRKQKLAIMEQYYPIDYSTEISIYEY